MNNLVGTNFLIDETDYKIVDVRDVDGVVMVYAEPSDGSRGPGRATFRYDDVRCQLGTSEVA